MHSSTVIVFRVIVLSRDCHSAGKCTRKISLKLRSGDKIQCLPLSKTGVNLTRKTAVTPPGIMQPTQVLSILGVACKGACDQ